MKCYCLTVNHTKIKTAILYSCIQSHPAALFIISTHYLCDSVMFIYCNKSYMKYLLVLVFWLPANGSNNFRINSYIIRNVSGICNGLSSFLRSSDNLQTRVAELQEHPVWRERVRYDRKTSGKLRSCTSEWMISEVESIIL